MWVLRPKFLRLYKSVHTSYATIKKKMNRTQIDPLTNVCIVPFRLKYNSITNKYIRGRKY
jgi:effector-binding domain-containing protein